MVQCPFITRCRVPALLEPVTTIGPEASARNLDVAPAAVDRIWRAVETLYRSGMHPAIQLCVRHRGQMLIDRAIGHACGNGPADPPETPRVRVTPATPFVVFSASKAMTAMVIHLLDQQNVIHLDDRVCDYIPELGVGSKQWITIRHVLIHRAGLPNLPPEAIDLDQLDDPGGIVRILCDTPLTWRPGRQLAYHAFTGGFILAELVRRVTGRTIRAVLDDVIRRPLGFRWLSYGVEPGDLNQVGLSYFTGPPALPPLSLVLRRALGVEFHKVPAMANDPRFLLAIVPSANIVASANEMSRFYQLLLDGGELDGVRVFDPRTIRRATAEQSYLEFDLTLGLPFRYSMGFMLGAEWLSLYGPGTSHAFGHLGFTNVIAWADPERHLAAALVTSGKPLIYPQLYHVWDVLRQIGVACRREPLSARRPTAVVPPTPQRPAAS